EMREGDALGERPSTEPFPYRVARLAAMLCRVGGAPVPPTERAFISEGHALEGLWTRRRDGSAEALDPDPITEHADRLLEPSDAQAHVELASNTARCDGVPDQHDIGRWLGSEGDLRLVLVAPAARRSPVLATEVHRSLLLRQREPPAVADLVRRLHEWDDHRNGLLVGGEQGFECEGRSVVDVRMAHRTCTIQLMRTAAPLIRFVPVER